MAVPTGGGHGMYRRGKHELLEIEGMTNRGMDIESSPPHSKLPRIQKPETLFLRE